VAAPITDCLTIPIPRPTIKAERANVLPKPLFNQSCNLLTRSVKVVSDVADAAKHAVANRSVNTVNNMILFLCFCKNFMLTLLSEKFYVYGGSFLIEKAILQLKRFLHVFIIANAITY
jgi:hypothetical protein